MDAVAPSIESSPSSLASRQRLTAADTAALAVIPCAALTVLAVALVGPPVGSALFDPGRVHFIANGVLPEPIEHGRYLIAALAPFVLSGVIALRAGGRRPADGSRQRAAVSATKALVLAFVTFALVAQHALTYRGAMGVLFPEHRVFFTTTTLVVAVVLAVAGLAVLHRAAAVEQLRRATRDTPKRRIAAAGIAALMVALWMLTAFNTEGSIGRVHPAVQDNVPFWLDETFAVLNGLAPLATFHAQYAQLWPYVEAGFMTVLGASFGVYAGVMVLATSLTMLAVFATFRRVARSSLIALALFAPFLATSFFKEQGTLDDRYGPSNLFSLFPIRYGGPYVLAWLVARRLSGARPHSSIALCFVAGLVALNNLEFGGPALAATLAALVWTLPRVTWRSAARVAAAGAVGVAGALAAIVLVTLIAAGRLPRLELLLEFSRVYGLAGFGMLPMPTVGFHLAIYLTFAAALVVATVRAVASERDIVLTGLLCWIGVFGLGVGGYYAGRSHPEVLIDLFSPWAFALALLLVTAVRAVHARPSRWPTPLELAVVLGFGLAVCSIGQTPTPWSQLARLSKTTDVPRYKPLASEEFIRRHTTPGDRVMIVMPLGHRMAHDIGVTNPFPYAHIDSMPAFEQWQDVFRILRQQRVDSLFFPDVVVGTHFLARLFRPTVVRGIEDTGFTVVVARSPAVNMVQFKRRGPIATE